MKPSFLQYAENQKNTKLHFFGQTGRQREDPQTPGSFSLMLHPEKKAKASLLPAQQHVVTPFTLAHCPKFCPLF